MGRVKETTLSVVLLVLKYSFTFMQRSKPSKRLKRVLDYFYPPQTRGGRFQQIAQVYYPYADGTIIVFDVTNLISTRHAF